MSNLAKIFGAFLLAALALYVSITTPKPNIPKKFTVIYTDRVATEELAPYDLIILDGDHYPPLEPLAAQGKLLLGYVSAGEAEERKPYFKTLRDKNALLHENKSWAGSHTVDVRQEIWTRILLDEIIPALLQKGFHGIFLDTFDSPLHAEELNPAAFAGMQEASVRLIKVIRLRYPNIPIMLNRGYKLLPEVGHVVDMALGEAVAGDYDFAKKGYVHVPEDAHKKQVGWLKAAKRRNRDLLIYTLDYAKRDDVTRIKELYDIERAHGFHPYVATVELNVVIPEPQ